MNLPKIITREDIFLRRMHEARIVVEEAKRLYDQMITTDHYGLSAMQAISPGGSF